MRHLRLRHGKNGSGGDCLNLDSGSLNTVLDSISMQFSTDENMSSFGSPPENLTLQWSLNGWGLESHSCGGLWDQNHATAHHTGMSARIAASTANARSLRTCCQLGSSVQTRTINVSVLPPSS